MLIVNYSRVSEIISRLGLNIDVFLASFWSKMIMKTTHLHFGRDCLFWTITINKDTPRSQKLNYFELFNSENISNLFIPALYHWFHILMYNFFGDCSLCPRGHKNYECPLRIFGQYEPFWLVFFPAVKSFHSFILL